MGPVVSDPLVILFMMLFILNLESICVFFLDESGPLGGVRTPVLGSGGPVGPKMTKIDEIDQKRSNQSNLPISGLKRPAHGIPRSRQARYDSAKEENPGFLGYPRRTLEPYNMVLEWFLVIREMASRQPSNMVV